MTHLSKILLAVAIVGLGGGSILDFCYVKASPALAAVLPLGAVAFGLFLIVFMLEREVAKYDEEQARKTQLNESNTAPDSSRTALTAQPMMARLKEKAL